jgi:hypothetical protein
MSPSTLTADPSFTGTYLLRPIKGKTTVHRDRMCRHFTCLLRSNNRLMRYRQPLPSHTRLATPLGCKYNSSSQCRLLLRTLAVPASSRPSSRDSTSRRIERCATTSTSAMGDPALSLAKIPPVRPLLITRAAKQAKPGETFAVALRRPCLSEDSGQRRPLQSRSYLPRTRCSNLPIRCSHRHLTKEMPLLSTQSLIPTCSTKCALVRTQATLISNSKQRESARQTRSNHLHTSEFTTISYLASDNTRSVATECFVSLSSTCIPH